MRNYTFFPKILLILSPTLDKTPWSAGGAVSWGVDGSEESIDPDSTENVRCDISLEWADEDRFTIFRYSFPADAAVLFAKLLEIFSRLNFLVTTPWPEADDDWRTSWKIMFP